MKLMRNIVLVLVCLFVSCSQKSQTPATETGDSMEAELLSEENEALQYAGDRKIAVVFGYGYNDEPFSSEIKPQIAAKFGLASENGLVLPLLFPGDFTNGRISLLDGMLEDYDICGLIVIGAPERTYAVLARLQDSWGQDFPAYPVIMLAPQDDVLGIEAGADLVLDFAAANEPDALEEQAVKPVDEMPEILFTLIRYMYSIKDEFNPVEANVRSDVLELLKAEGAWEITPYIDSETGLYAINHFILEKGKAAE